MAFVLLIGLLRKSLMKNFLATATKRGSLPYYTWRSKHHGDTGVAGLGELVASYMLKLRYTALSPGGTSSSFPRLLSEVTSGSTVPRMKPQPPCFQVCLSHLHLCQGEKVVQQIRGGHHSSLRWRLSHRHLRETPEKIHNQHFPTNSH